jgi:hypothetical protein
VHCIKVHSRDAAESEGGIARLGLAGHPLKFLSSRELEKHNDKNDG